MNLFWLFLILRVAKNYVITTVAVDVRSDNEEEEEDGAKDEPAAVSGAYEDDANDKAARKIEGGADMKDGKPAVLLNGKPISAPAHPEPVVERRRRKNG